MSYELRQDPYALLEQARFNYTLRKAIIGVLIGLTTFFIWTHREDLRFAFHTADPIDLGNVRTHYEAQKTTLGAQHGQYVKLSGLIPTRYRVGQGEDEGVHFTDYFCPIFNIAVRTTEIPPAPPDFNGRQFLGTFPSEYIDLVQKRRVHVENLHVHASVEGRIYRMDQPPAYADDVADYYEKHLDRPIQESWIMLDGLTPASVRHILWIALGFIGVALFAIWGLVRARRRLYDMARNLHTLGDG